MRPADVCHSHLDTLLSFVDASVAILESPPELADSQRVVIAANGASCSEQSAVLPNALRNYVNAGAALKRGECASWSAHRYGDATLIIELALDHTTGAHGHSGSDSRRKPVTKHATGGTLWLALIFDNVVPDWLLSQGPEHRRQLAVFEKMLNALSLVLSVVISQNRLLTDRLTQLPSRTGFQSSLAGLVSQYTVAVVLIHCADLHAINQRYGPADGDTVILNMAKALTDVTRDGDIVCRFGGALFGVGIAVNKSCDAMNAARKMQSHLHQQQILDKALSLRFNIGVAVIEFDDKTSSARDKVSTLISRADRALSAAEQPNRRP